jgi:hypothetical protein
MCVQINRNSEGKITRSLIIILLVVKKNSYRISFRKPEGKKTLGISVRRCKDNIEMGLVGTGLISFRWWWWWW